MAKKKKSGRKKSKSKSRKSKKKMKVNPRTGRKTVYLGHRVKDTGKPGLDNLKEVEGIAKAILRDYKAGRIDKKTASGRFAELRNRVIPRTKALRGKVRKAQAIVDKYWDQL